MFLLSLSSQHHRHGLCPRARLPTQERWCRKPGQRHFVLHRTVERNAGRRLCGNLALLPLAQAGLVAQVEVGEGFHDYSQMVS